MAYKLNMTFLLWFPKTKISWDDFKISDRKCYALFDISFFIHLCHFNWLFQSSYFQGYAHWLLHSWTCVLWTRQSLVICSQGLYFTDKWIWQKNCLGKAIPQASQQFLPSFFTSIEKGKGRIWLLSYTERYTETPPDFCMELTFFLSPIQDGYMQKSVTDNIHPLKRICVCEKQTEIEKGGRSSECFHYLRVHLLFLCARDPSVCFSLYDLSVRWRLRVLCMKIKCALWQFCSLRKTDGLLQQTSDLWAQNEKKFGAHCITLCVV